MFGEFPAKNTAAKNTVHTPYIYLNKFYLFIYYLLFIIYLFYLFWVNYMRVRAASWRVCSNVTDAHRTSILRSLYTL